MIGKRSDIQAVIGKYSIGTRNKRKLPKKRPYNDNMWRFIMKGGMMSKSVIPPKATMCPSGSEYCSYVIAS